jgi:glycosyltransferase involved in cell wall biosynthesis
MTRSLRVLLLTETYLPEIGGGERQAELLSSALRQRGHRVTIITRRSRTDLPRRELLAGIEVLRIGPAGPGRWKKWGLAVTTAPALMRAASRADVALVSGFRILGIPSGALGPLLRIPVVLKADSTGEMSGSFFAAGLARLGLTPAAPPVRGGLAIRNALLRRASGFVAMSTEIAEELAASGIPPDRIHRIPNGVDTRTFSPAPAATRAALRQRLALPAGPIAIYTGRLVTYKGLPMLLDAWHRVVQGEAGATLVLAGTAGGDMHACEHELREFVRQQGLGRHVRFTGAVHNVHEYLQAADVFVFPTLNEAFGVSLLEAMACGLPCVASRVGGIPDFLLHEHNGLLVEPGNEEQLTAALQRLLAGGSDAAALGARARETVVREYSGDSVAEAYVALCTTLISKRTRASSPAGSPR